MKNIKIIWLALLCFIGSNVRAQSIDNALLFSKKDLLGNARFVGMGGAFGAFGANHSSMSVNPAGLALYRRGDFSFSLGVGNMNSTSTYMGNSVDDTNSSFRLDHIGMAFSAPGEGNVVRGNFGVVYNKLADYNEEYTITGNVENTTMLDIFSAQATGFDEEALIDNFDASAGLAYWTFLINPVETGSLVYDNEIPSGPATQSKKFTQSGRSGETLIAGGANINNKVYIGGSLGMHSTRLEQNYTYSEGNLDPQLELDQFTFSENLIVTGSGINLKGGIIVQAQEWLRLGMALHTPTWTTLTGTYSRSMTSSFLNGTEKYERTSNDYTYIYRLRTPTEVHVNTGIIIGKNALIGADYSFVNYGSMKMSNANDPLVDVDYSSQNNAIEDTYRGAHNFNVGAEVRMAKIYYVRGGFNYRQSPFEENVTQTDGDVVTISGGAGMRVKGIYFDAGYSVANAEQDHFMYSSSDIQAATIDKTRGQLVLTLGARL